MSRMRSDNELSIFLNMRIWAFFRNITLYGIIIINKYTFF